MKGVRERRSRKRGRVSRRKEKDKREMEQVGKEGGRRR